MYYAYSISLMYFLRARNDRGITSAIFDKLNLEPSQKNTLVKVLKKSPTETFSPSDTKNIIEPILGAATRKLAASATKKEFKKAPRNTSLFAAATYGIEYYFKLALQKRGSHLAQYIDNDFTNTDFTNAEIYKLDLVKEGMEIFATDHVERLIELFSEANTAESMVLLNDLMKENTIEFFKKDDGANLTLYKKHLAKDYVWGTEETLMVLHRAIQGERTQRNDQGKIEIVKDTNISLEVYKDNSPVSENKTADLIINNIRNGHWTSIIPAAIYTPFMEKGKVKDAKNTNSIQATATTNELYKALDALKTARDNIPRGKKERVLARLLIINLDKNIKILTRSNAISEQSQAISNCIDRIKATAPKLGQYKSWGQLFHNFFCALLEAIPVFLGGKHIRSALEDVGLYSTDRRAEIVKSCDRVKTALENYKPVSPTDESASPSTNSGAMTV